MLHILWDNSCNTSLSPVDNNCNHKITCVLHSSLNLRLEHLLYMRELGRITEQNHSGLSRKTEIRHFYTQIQKPFIYKHPIKTQKTMLWKHCNSHVQKNSGSKKIPNLTSPELTWPDYFYLPNRVKMHLTVPNIICMDICGIH